MTDRPSPSFPILATLLVLAALLGAYAGGYYGLSERNVVIQPNGPGGLLRLYRFGWLAITYRPAAWIESAVTGQRVEATTMQEVEAFYATGG
jgi:hypothetical protein